MNQEFVLQTKKIAERMSKVKYRIAVMSGKGGVGKSTVSALLASSLAKNGFRVALLDGDVTGASIPRMFGLKERPGLGENGIIPVVSRAGVKIVSINLLLQAESQAVIWRGPLISGAIRQLIADTDWGEPDFFIVDLPPGTSDAQLTVVQAMRLSGVILVSTPQDLVEMVVMKAVDMLNQTNTKILGLVMNMESYRCPHCGNLLHPFGKTSSSLSKLGIPLLANIPVDENLSELCDNGRVEEYESAEVSNLSKSLLSILETNL